ncbi:hypothetical protein J7L85_02090, partial [candidate division WOR-3 bacterium]|nr:hypothetical protein [candidate division WOR-3 bacterium]
SRPGIEPKRSFLLLLYQSLFNEESNLKIWHAGEKMSIIPFKIGGLEIYNQVEIPEETIEFSKSLMNQIKDAQSKKGKLLLEYLFCKIYSENLKNRHIKSLFEFLAEYIIKDEIHYEFTTPGTLQTEDILEFKSADEVLGKPSKFVKEKLVPTLRDYIDGPIKRYCIIYGIEDEFLIKPIYHLKNDRIPEIERKANESLSDKNVRIHILAIPYNGGLVLAVYMIPIYGGDTL